LPKVDAGLAASIFHFGEVEISTLKKTLSENDIIMRL
jgi:cyclase